MMKLLPPTRGQSKFEVGGVRAKSHASTSVTADTKPGRKPKLALPQTVGDNLVKLKGHGLHFLKMKKIILLIISIIVSNHTFSQIKLDSLFNSIDSLTLIHVGLAEKEHNDVGFYQTKCYESAFHFSTNSTELILDTFEALDFKESSEIFFCGFDYKIQGFKQQKEIFEIDYNSQCNYAKMGYSDYKTDTLYKYEGLKKYLRFGETSCEFRTTELLDCYLESLKKDQRIEIITLTQVNDLELFYRFKKTIANNGSCCTTTK